MEDKSINQQDLQHLIKVLAILTESLDTMDSKEGFFLKKAIRRLDMQNWKNAIMVEYCSLIENEAWSFFDSPQNWKVISGQWVFKLKKNREGKILEYKARWVVHGYKQ